MSLRGRLSLIGAVAVLAAACSGGGASPAPASQAPASQEPASVAPESSAPAESAAASPSEAAASIDPNSLLGKVMAAGQIRISTDPNYAPFSSVKSDGTYEGFDTSVAEETVKRLNEKLGTDIELKWETPGWDLITAGNWSGRWDLSIGSMSVTESRAKVVDFADPYYFDGGGVAVPADSAVTTIDELAGKTFCVGTATTYEQWLNGTLEIVDPAMIAPPANPQVTALPTDNECIQAVQVGRKYDAIVANKNGLESAVEKGQPIKLLLDEPIFTVSVSFALDKSGPDTASMLEVLNEIVADMHADGTLKALSEQWLGEDVTTKPS